jgi:hypothetical protein
MFLRIGKTHLHNPLKECGPICVCRCHVAVDRGNETTANTEEGSEFTQVYILHKKQFNVEIEKSGL